jgi:hypothetical protein
MTQIKMEVLTYIDLYERSKGKPIISSNIYFGDNSETSIVKNIAFSEIINNWIDANSIPNGTMKQEHRDAAKAPLKKMHNILTAAMKRINEMPEWAPE